MDIDISSESNEENPEVKENGFLLFPVSANESGEGLPYAPENWPNPGDKWLWKVGKRITTKGFFSDRYLYPPSRRGSQLTSKNSFASKITAQEYIQKTFSGADVDAFFASFSWRIPAAKEGNCVLKRHREKLKPIIVSPGEISHRSEPDSVVEGEFCKANNMLCSTLLEPKDSNSLEPMACDLCCSEPNFCRDCCCILCSKHVNYAYGGYSFIKCKADMGDGSICGHIAHIECALRCYMAGTVGGTIGLDAEYYCRRCDNITDFISHVSNLLRTCEFIKSLEDVEKVLNVGTCVLRGSQKTSARNLLDRIELTISKLKDGACLVDMWKDEDVSSGLLPQHVIDEMETENNQESIAFGDGSPKILPINFNLRHVSRKLEDEIDQMLHSLRNAQKSEFRIADNTLHAQKNHIIDLYRQLENERLELHAKTKSESSEFFLEALREREYQIKRAVEKLRVMKQVTRGFGMTSKDVLEEHFGLSIDL